MTMVLPKEIKKSIFPFLGLLDIISVARVSKGWNEAAQEEIDKRIHTITLQLKAFKDFPENTSEKPFLVVKRFILNRTKRPSVEPNNWMFQNKEVDLFKNELEKIKNHDLSYIVSKLTARPAPKKIL